MDAPPDETIIRRHRGWVPLDWRELWRYRELLLFLIWRDLLVRYKQTVVGLAWAALQPLVTMVAFTLVFGKLAKLDSQGLPYPVMIFAALLPWQFFATAVRATSDSVVASAGMISKIYFPRLLVPVSAALSGLTEWLVGLALLAGLLLLYRLPLQPQVLLLPLFMLAALATALGAGLWLAAINVRYRDVKHLVPFLVQVGLFLSPVGFSSALVPPAWRLLYHLNPLVGVIDGCRWAILGPAFVPYWPGCWLGLGVALALLVSGAYFFRHQERTFADII